MEDLIKKIFFAGVGSLSLTYDKSKELINELIERGKITVDQGREVNEELKRIVRDEGKIEKESLIDQLNLVSQEDLEDILARLDRIEKRNED